MWLLASAAVDCCDSFDGTFVSVVVATSRMINAPVVAVVDDDVAVVETI